MQGCLVFKDHARLLGPDRDLVRGELAKLVLYCKGPNVSADELLAYRALANVARIARK